MRRHPFTYLRITLNTWLIHVSKNGFSGKDRYNTQVQLCLVPQNVSYKDRKAVAADLLRLDLERTLPDDPPLLGPARPHFLPIRRRSAR